MLELSPLRRLACRRAALAALATSPRRALAVALACLALASVSSAGAGELAPRPGRGGARPRSGRAPVKPTIDRIVKAAMAKNDTPGLMIAVVDQGRGVFERGYGGKQV